MRSIKVQLLETDLRFASLRLSNFYTFWKCQCIFPNQLDFHAQFRLSFGKPLESCTVELARSGGDNASTKASPSKCCLP